MALSEDLAFEWILTDIPLFCVGLMGMGFVTFVFATLKRVNLDAFYLYVTSLLLFFAAILDLGQLLLRGPAKVSQNLDLNSVAGFIISREIILALSSGFLFLFFWKVVGQCPPAEKRLSLRKFNKTGEVHSASWSRWGLPGIVLQWFTLALVVVNTLLQIVWRIVGAQRVYGSVYTAQTILEIVASGIFILKILFNVFVSPETSRWVPFRLYLGLISAIMITTAIGIGNLVMFAFSDTVLGRFLHAIGIYILLVTNLINIFHKSTSPRVPIDDEEAGQSSKISDSEKLQELTIETEVQPAAILPQRSPSIITVDRILPSPLATNRLPVRTVSGASRLSTFVNRAVMSPVLELTEGSSSLSTNFTPSRGLPAKSSALISPVKRSRMSDLHFDIVTPRGETFDSRSNRRPTTDISLSYYTMDIGSDLLAAPNVTAVHGSNETLASSSSSHTHLVPQSKPGHRGSNSLSSFDELMRQQNELDQSIANLKFLSFDMYGSGSGSQKATKQTSLTETSASMKSRPQSTLVSDSLSPHSEFSLSVFPEPPTRPESVIPAASSVRLSIPLMLRRKIARHSFSNSLQIHPHASIPGSPHQNSFPPRMTSAGTQYDVTSFIGDLTSPGNQEVPTTMASAQNDLQESAQESELPDQYGQGDVVPETKATNLRPMFLPSAAKERRPLPSITSPSGNPSETVPTILRPRAMTLRPLYLGTPAGSVPVPLSASSTTVPLGPRRASRAARIATHKSQISIPKPDLDALPEDSPEAYERPRPPPSLLESGQPKS